MGKLKTCNKCYESLPATPEHFHRNRSTKDGLVYTCKACANLATREHKRRKGRVSGVAAMRLESESIQMKEVKAKRYKKGVYKVTASYKSFKGELIQQTDRFITLKNKHGTIESFLKVDLKIGTLNIKGVNQ